MALPNQIDASSPLGSDAPSTLDNQIRSLKQAIIDILGVPSATNVSVAFLSGAAGGLDQVIFLNAAADATVAGRLRRNATNLTWHDGTAARNLATIDGGQTFTSATWNGTAIGAVYGGTGLTTYTLGDLLYSPASNTLAKLAGNTATARKFLAQTGDGSVSAAPSWVTLFTGFSSMELIRKTSDETINNSTTLQNDDALTVSVAANEILAFDLIIHHVGNNTADLKISMIAPVGAAGFWSIPVVSEDTAGSASAGYSSRSAWDGTGTFNIGAGTAVRELRIHGLLRNGANAGSLTFQWTQFVATVVDTKVLTDSHMLVWRG